MKWAALAGAVLLLAAALAVLFLARGWWREAEALAEAHASYRVAHRGWSFPAKIVTQAVPLHARFARLVAEARARGYQPRCPAPGPGEFCEANRRLVPRSGAALEPVILGWLIGPDQELREHLPLSEAPQHLLDAVLVAEDRDFYAHRGVELMALLRAAIADLRHRGWAQGGSTLTMQVVRSWQGRREKTLTRKLREAVMALAIDRTLGKSGVLQAYLDAPYLGQRGGTSVCGFEAAAQHYFGKPARALDLAEAATLAAVLPAPGRFAPDRSPELARERRDRVLRALAQHKGYDVRAALASPLRLAPRAPLPERYPAYLSAVRAWLEARLPQETLYGAGLTIVAAVDVPSQEQTEQLFAEKLLFYETLVGGREAPLQSAAVLLDVQTGALRAIWGGFGAGPYDFNRATQAMRQPGSAFKPVVYSFAFSQPPLPDGRPAYTAASLEPNRPRLFQTDQGDWIPRNSSEDYSDAASLAYALAWSQNIATASLLEDLGGPRPLIDFARGLGFEVARFPAELGLALGQGETTVLQMAQFAGVVANGGLRLPGHPVLRVTDAAGIERLRAPPVGPRALSPEAAALTRDLMRLVIDAGTGGAARGANDEPGYAGEALGKTGTTDQERDVWFVGATPRYAAAVWLGYDVPQALGASASDLAAPLWGWWLRRVTAHEGPPPHFPRRPALEHRRICNHSGQLAREACPALDAPFLPGTAPTVPCGMDHLAPREVAGEPPVAPARYQSIWKRLRQPGGLGAKPPAEAPPRPAP